MNSNKKLLQKAKFLALPAGIMLLHCMASAQTNLRNTGAKINVMSGAFMSAGNITNSSGDININASTLKVAGSIANSSTIDATAGTVEANGTSAQIIPANTFYTNTIKNFTVNNTSGVSLAGALGLTDVLTISNGSLSSAGNLTLKSSILNTARFAPVTSLAATPVSGNVIVERYVLSKRAYRLMTVPVNTFASIKANWMEGVNNSNPASNINPVPGYGTQISGTTGNAGGFDVTNTNNNSMFTFNSATQSWSPIPNTSGNFAAGTGYRIIVRGDRSTNLLLNAPTPSQTILRAAGSLVTGDVMLTRSGGGGTAGMPALSNTDGGFTMIGNPYASPVDFSLVERTNVSGNMYMFDPTLGGSSSKGAFVCYNSTLNAMNNGSTVMSRHIQSGQAFFVQTTAVNPVLTFRESHKSSTYSLVSRDASSNPRVSVQLFSPKDSANAVDGVGAYFSDDYSDAIGEDDSYKFTNQEENLAMIRNGESLSLEGRKAIKQTDTVQLKLWQLSPLNYTLKVKVDNLEPNVEAYLEDAYKQSRMRLDNNSVTDISYNTTSDSASMASDRLRIVFRTAATMAVKITNIEAYQREENIQVDWTANAESNMSNYVVEKSADGRDFKKMSTVSALNNSQPAVQYSSTDEAPVAGDNYYRIRSLSKSGEIEYTKVVKVSKVKAENAVSIYPNPVTGKAMNLVFKNAKAGSYSLRILNAAGQAVLEKNIKHTGSTANYAVDISGKTSSGIYQLNITGNGIAETMNVIVE